MSGKRERVMSTSGSPLAHAGHNLRLIMRSPAAWTVAAVVMLLHAAFAGFVPVADSVRWYETLGLERAGFLSGKIWQIASHAFLHGGWWHAGMNAFFVVLIGSRVEHIAGRAVVWRVLAAGILGGGAGHLLLGAGLLVGMSGGCLALLLLLTTLSPQSRMLPIPVSGRSLGFGILFSALLLALVNPQLGVPGFADVGREMERHGLGSWFRMGHACHFGGGLAGWFYGRWMLRPRITLASLRRDRERRGQQ
jgi:membrane associated rhomboid family serine protease